MCALRTASDRNQDIKESAQFRSGIHGAKGSQQLDEGRELAFSE
jgi:hypothetical protein